MGGALVRYYWLEGMMYRCWHTHSRLTDSFAEELLRYRVIDTSFLLHLVN